MELGLCHQTQRSELSHIYVAFMTIAIRLHEEELHMAHIGSAKNIGSSINSALCIMIWCKFHNWDILANPP